MEELPVGEGDPGASGEYFTEAELELVEQAMLEEEAMLGEPPDDEELGDPELEQERRRSATDCKTYLYQHDNFAGHSKLYYTGSYGSVWRNDDVSSIKVIGDGCKAIVYQHFNFEGWSVELPAIPGSYNYDVLRSMGFKNDEMSSLKVIQGPTSDGSTTRRLSEMMEAKALEMIDAHAAPVNELMPPPPAF